MAEIGQTHRGLPTSKHFRGDRAPRGVRVCNWMMSNDAAAT
eukprot:CAMPEP_0195004652 /NCGR_PEP_ID=MMETSP0326_2-20130528/4772_1 /TAXON_ID=2866 ORGANISM="Crypthecodinium cohnii, Strain Seligo" /NCGR_SAMPLE_ID=MMETSP0326_2 /ASSEMBLY_ACC=CAM_ASM_000348 /LENGTH=40 /DNA_ID= /DNA_START= /DNA_END= /DNA_ORIENTATION=